MPKEDQDSANSSKSERFKEAITRSSEPSDVPPEERRIEVLDFLVEHQMPLPPVAIYRGLKLQRSITFGDSTVQNICTELADGGDLIRVDKKALDNGVIKPLPDDETDRRAWYYPTDAGRERLAAYEDQ